MTTGFADNHAHSLRKNFLSLDLLAFRACWTESRLPDAIDKHLPHHLHYQDVLAQLHSLLGTTSEATLIAKRQSGTWNEQQYVRMLFKDAGIERLVIDDGLSTDEWYSLEEFQQLLGDDCLIAQCRRIEVLLQNCLQESNSFSELDARFREQLLAPNPYRPFALKTIMAYRGGLGLDFVSERDAERDFAAAKLEGSRRISRRPLYHYFLAQAFIAAGEAKIPVQVHTGFGDDDATIIESNPALLQQMIKSPDFAGVNWILLHCYPYIREAALLAALYANVYMDLSLAVILISPIIDRLLDEAIACAPIDKVLFGTDGHTIPEMHWYGAHRWREVISKLGLPQDLLQRPVF
jgi:hypothetical protein